MKKTKLKLITCLLVILMLLTIVSGCTTGGKSDTSSKPESQATTSTVETTRKNAKDNLPDKNFGGRDFVIFCRDEHLYEYAEKETATEFVNDVIQKRNATVEDRFGVKIKTFSIPGNWGTHSEFFTTLRSHLQSGADDYQLVAGYAAIIPSLVAENMFLNWQDIKYIDLNQPWWSKNLNNELTINDRLFLLTGDISLTLWENMCAMFFNKKIAQENDLPNLYELVRKGEWTFDKMTEFAKNATKDNGDDVWTKEDTYGYISIKTTQVDVYQEAFDLTVTKKNSQGIPEFMMKNTKTYDAVNMLYEFLCQSNYAFTAFATSEDQEQYTMFGEQRALFLPARLQWGEYINQFQIEYGILPMPKFNEEQQGYYSTSIDNYSMIAVPYTVKDTDFVGIITEALCAESYRNVVEDYYQSILRSRYVNDEDSADMVDIVRDGLRFNFGYVYSFTLDWPAHQINICINNNTADFVSLWDSKETIFKQKLDEHLKVYLD